MGDQARWFKFWCSAPSDEHIQRLSATDAWAWAALGAYTKLHGTRGFVILSEANLVLAAQMKIDANKLYETCARLPHLTCQKSDYGEFTVTWHNWIKFQEDSTQAERQKTSRSKKRREEKRKEEKRFPPKSPPRMSHDIGSNELDHEAKKRAARELLKRAGLTPPRELAE